MLTKVEKAKWLARLRDPDSKQAIGAGAYTDISCMNCAEGIITNSNQPMCCLVHGQFAIEGIASTGRIPNIHYTEWCDKHEIPKGKLMTFNDTERWSLPRIADWIEVNIPTSD